MRVDCAGCLFPTVQEHNTSDTPGCSCDGCGPELLRSSVRPYLDTSPVSISALQRSRWLTFTRGRCDTLATRVGGRDNARGDADEGDGPTHFQNSTAAIVLNQSIWHTALDRDTATVPRFVEPEALQKVLAAARASRKREHMYAELPDAKKLSPSLAELVSATARDAQI